MTLSLEEMKANRRKWVEALRSGEFKQATGTLHSPAGGGYCCLGVAASILGIPDEDLMPGSPGVEYAYSQVQNSLGLCDALGSFGYDRHEGLARLNDDGKLFDTIANIIEREPPGLFIDSTPTGSAS
jgi:hypothetical protein